MGLQKIVLNTGDRFGRLTIISETDATYFGKFRKRMFLCKCDCGNETVVDLSNLRGGHTKSCGCLIIDSLVKHRRTHGLSKTRLHGIWASMLSRCRNSSIKEFKYYGAKGVGVCSEWLEFKPFYDWAIANGYEKSLTIDRINPFGNYEPCNCRWATMLEQRHNRRDSVGNAQ